MRVKFSLGIPIPLSVMQNCKVSRSVTSVRTINFDVPEGGRTADYKLFVAFEKASG